MNFRIDFIEPGAPVLAAASDSGASDRDGLTKETKPLIGTTTVGSDKKWSFTVGSQPEKLAAFSAGEHALTVKQVDAYGNVSAASTALAITVDTAAPTFAIAPDFHDAKTWAALIFNEKIEFTGAGSIDVLNASNEVLGHYTAGVHTNWAIVANDSDVAGTVLELDLGSGIDGPLHLQVNGVTVADLAGNAAVIGSPSFTIVPS